MASVLLLKFLDIIKPHEDKTKPYTKHGAGGGGGVCRGLDLKGHAFFLNGNGQYYANMWN